MSDEATWKARYERHNQERLEALNCNAWQAREIARLRADLAAAQRERDEAQAVCSGVMRHIPMNFLQANDAPGATGPTKALDLVAAVRAWAESRWEDRRRVEAFVEKAEDTERNLAAAQEREQRMREALKPGLANLDALLNDHGYAEDGGMRRIVSELRVALGEPQWPA